MVRNATALGEFVQGTRRLSSKLRWWAAICTYFTNLFNDKISQQEAIPSIKFYGLYPIFAGMCRACGKFTPPQNYSLSKKNNLRVAAERKKLNQNPEEARGNETRKQKTKNKTKYYEDNSEKSSALDGGAGLPGAGQCAKSDGG